MNATRPAPYIDPLMKPFRVNIAEQKQEQVKVFWPGSSTSGHVHPASFLPFYQLCFRFFFSKLLLLFFQKVDTISMTLFFIFQDLPEMDGYIVTGGAPGFFYFFFLSFFFHHWIGEWCLQPSSATFFNVVHWWSSRSAPPPSLSSTWRQNRQFKLKSPHSHQGVPF